MIIPFWIPVAVNLLWSIGNAVWSALNTRMENRLLRAYVSKLDCEQWQHEHGACRGMDDEFAGSHGLAE